MSTRISAVVSAKLPAETRKGQHTMEMSGDIPRLRFNRRCCTTQWQAHKNRQLLPGTSRQAHLDDRAPEGHRGERPMLFIEGSDLVDGVFYLCIFVCDIGSGCSLRDKELRLIIFF